METLKKETNHRIIINPSHVLSVHYHDLGACDLEFRERWQGDPINKGGNSLPNGFLPQLDHHALWSECMRIKDHFQGKEPSNPSITGIGQPNQIAFNPDHVLSVHNRGNGQCDIKFKELYSGDNINITGGLPRTFISGKDHTALFEACIRLSQMNRFK